MSFISAANYSLSVVRALVIVASFLIIAQVKPACAQWTNGTNNSINNTNSGNVGVGTTTPAQKVDVAGSIASSDRCQP